MLQAQVVALEICLQAPNLTNFNRTGMGQYRFQNLINPWPSQTALQPVVFPETCVQAYYTMLTKWATGAWQLGNNLAHQKYVH